MGLRPVLAGPGDRHSLADFEWLFHASAAILVALVGLVASILPARRAGAVEPLLALRHE